MATVRDKINKAIWSVRSWLILKLIGDTMPVLANFKVEAPEGFKGTVVNLRKRKSLSYIVVGCHFKGFTPGEKGADVILSPYGER